MSKFDYLVGTENDFSGAVCDCTLKIWHVFLGPMFCTESTIPRQKGVSIIAMRRIIPEPKRWTVEDQKAGRLPDVGSEVILRIGGEIATVNAANKNMVCLTFSDGGFSSFNVERIDPIETPEEKAQRLRSEWINKAYVDFHRLGCELDVLQKEQIKQIYDALLSGELTMPSKGE